MYLPQNRRLSSKVKPSQSSNRNQTTSQIFMLLCFAWLYVQRNITIENSFVCNCFFVFSTFIFTILPWLPLFCIYFYVYYTVIFPSWCDTLHRIAFPCCELFTTRKKKSSDRKWNGNLLFVAGIYNMQKCIFFRLYTFCTRKNVFCVFVTKALEMHFMLNYFLVVIQINKK